MNTEEEVYTKPKKDADGSMRLQHLKRKRTRERSNITRFVTEVRKFTESTTLEDCIITTDFVRPWTDWHL